MTVTVSEFFKLRDNLPAIDVRSEGEFADGHIPGAVNIPILNDEERKAVGTDYKHKGQLEAIKTGFRLVGPRILDIVNQAEQVAAGRELLVHCWRGGMRSSNFCQFIGMARIKSHQLAGGYKAYRTHVLESLGMPLTLRIVGGYTGSGKSEVLRALAARGEQVIDLEALANHKGSVFGGLMMPPQPSAEQFQNDLFEHIRRLDPARPIWIEDESITIGKLVLPDPFWKTMCNSPIIALEVDRVTRVQRLVNEYGGADKDDFLEAMSSIVKKLGGQHFQAAKEKLLAGDMASTIDILLTYYDKAYGMGLSKKQHRVSRKVAWDGSDINELAASLVL
ncbi:MAG TPA: tRNA 2-selenouridine(34) synthase MnmH [Chryseosolibacter sp.]|nr:tRNA 2-selenouridine(34) synthase MnmH [Chryseosolibacter sp.]